MEQKTIDIRTTMRILYFLMQWKDFLLTNSTEIKPSIYVFSQKRVSNMRFTWSYRSIVAERKAKSLQQYQEMESIKRTKASHYCEAFVVGPTGFEPVTPCL